MAMTPSQISRRTFLGTAIALAALPATATSPAFAGMPSSNRPDAPGLLATFDDRANAVLQEFAERDPVEIFEISTRASYVKWAIWYAQARLHLGVDLDRAFEIIDDVTNGDKSGGARWARHAAIDTYLRFGDQYPTQLQDDTRAWLVNMDAGNIAGTLNHQFMGAAALYLEAQTWPDQDNAAAKLAAAEAFFTQKLDDIVRFGWWEYGSPNYTQLYTMTLQSMADLATDPVMKQRALMALEWFLITMGMQWLDGQWVTPTSRTQSTWTPATPAGGMYSVGWLYFGGQERLNSFAVVHAGSAYRMPAILDSIVQQRAVPFVHRESQDMLFGANTAGFAITTYLTSGYGVASQFDGYGTFMDVRGGLANQSQRWMVRWVSPEIGSTLQFHHPTSDNLVHDDENNARYFYTGATPHEQVLQHNGTILAVYNIPQSHPAPFIRGPVTTPAVQQSIKHESGWIFSHGGSVLIAIRPLRPYVLEDRVISEVPVENLQSDGRKNGVIVETAAPAAYASLQDFADAVLAGTSIDSSGLNNPTPTYSYTTLAGDVLGITFNGDRTVNGVPVDYDAWPLVHNPYAHQDVGGDELVLTFDGQQRTYNFATLEITETGTVVDNDGPGYSDSGGWNTSTHVPGYWGVDYKADGSTGGKTATFQPNVSETGEYNIYLWWTEHQNRATEVPLEIHYDGGAEVDTAQSVNQHVDGGQWNLIGTYRLVAGSSDRVVIVAPGGGATVADAARFERV